MELLKHLLSQYPDATDLHITENETISLRVQGQLVSSSVVMSSEDMHRLYMSLSDKKQRQWMEEGSCDASFSEETIRCRLHLYRTEGKMAASLRILPSLAAIPSDPDPEWMDSIASLSDGLVLITGPSGSGKTTTLAHVIHIINSRRPCHIITLEDPVEYHFTSSCALIHQRSIGDDALDFPSAVSAAMREDPDVIVIGEMRDRKTMAAALTAAETGHLVLATLHARSAPEAIGRMVHAFPKEEQGEMRALMASVLRSSVSQRLFHLHRKAFLLREIMTVIPAVSHLIREEKEEQILSYMEMGRHYMRTMKQAVRAYCHEHSLSSEEKDILQQCVE